MSVEAMKAARDILADLRKVFGDDLPRHVPNYFELGHRTNKAISGLDAALKAAQPQGVIDGETLARKFHETYERLAPQFGYETRPETRAFDPTSPNGKLMIAVCNALLSEAEQPERVSVPREPTPEMLDKGAYACESTYATAFDAASAIYRAMLAAAQEGK